MRQRKTIICWATLISLGIHLLLCLLPLLSCWSATAGFSPRSITLEVVHEPATTLPALLPQPAPVAAATATRVPPPTPARQPVARAREPQGLAHSQRPAASRSATVALPGERAASPLANPLASPPAADTAQIVAFKQPAFMQGPSHPTEQPAPVMQLPQLLQEQRIPYPEQARQLGVEGTVRARLLVSHDGSVSQVEVLSGPGFGLNAAAARALQRFRFRPALDAQGSRRAHWITYGYTFRIED